jgi:hypothetical protein
MTLRPVLLVLPVLAAIAGGVATAAAGQSALPVPPVQVGAEVAFGSIGGGTERSARMFVPRFTVNFSPRWALDVTADRYQRRNLFGEFDERMVLVQVRSVIAESRHGIRLSGLLGAGVDFARYDFPAYAGTSFDPGTRGQTRIYPAESFTHRRALIFTGLAISRPITPYVSLHSEVKFFPFERFGFGARATVGVTAAVGRFPPASRTVALPVAPDRFVRVGQQVWVTSTDGTQLKGVVYAATAATLTVSRRGGRDTLPLGSVARIDVLEETTAARSRWMTIGGLAGLGLGLTLTASWVASNGGEGADAFGIWGPGMATLGIVTGGLIGAQIDRRHGQRRTVYDVSRPSAGTFTLTPILTRRAQGFGAAIRR